MFEYARAFGSPNGATYRRLDPQPRLHTGVWIPNRGYTRVFGSPTAATNGCLDPQPRLHTGVWRPNRGYTQVFGSPTGATYRCLSMSRRLDPQPVLRTGVWILNQGYTRVFGVPTGATHRCLESPTGDPASCQTHVSKSFDDRAWPAWPPPHHCDWLTPRLYQPVPGNLQDRLFGTPNTRV